MRIVGMQTCKLFFGGTAMHGKLNIKLKRFVMLFLSGGISYVILELLYRRRSHVSMFIDGGICLFMIDFLCNRIKMAKKISVFIRGLFASGIITCIEFVTGLIVNKRLKLKVWDYSHIPLNLNGQICLRYSLLWYMLSLPVIIASGHIVKKL
ncbi:hypothetical protein EOM86_08850 [Candidatus Nomurabacteria bacterium]|nr:hypothetical protein [Candidatus Nomurabacteria bacterium]